MHGMCPTFWRAGKSFSVVSMHECTWQTVEILGHNCILSNSEEKWVPKVYSIELGEQLSHQIN